MPDRQPWVDPESRASETKLRRRRLVAAVVTVVALAAVAGGSAVGAVASAHEDSADVSHHVVAR
jgi:hypothetical protein